MKLLRYSLLAIMIFVANNACAQVFHDEHCYQVGDQIAQDVKIFNAAGEPVPLLSLAKEDTRLIYLLIMGGPSLNPDHQRGGMWCGDSFNDMPASFFTANQFADKGVLFVPVICPPVYGESRYGYADGAFQYSKPGSVKFNAALKQFVQATRKLQEEKIIPFEEVYFDPQFRLLFNFEQIPHTSDFAGEILPWMGKFKPCDSRQTYSVPTIWLLSPKGEVMSEPFSGNIYSGEDMDIQYTLVDIGITLNLLLAE